MWMYLSLQNFDAKKRREGRESGFQEKLYLNVDVSILTKLRHQKEAGMEEVGFPSQDKMNLNDVSLQNSDAENRQDRKKGLEKGL